MSVKRIKLKEKSPEFDEGAPKPNKNVPVCDMPSCQAAGEHKAPRDRSLADHYHFCFDHVREYNAAWDFFEGMSPIDIEKHMRDSMFGDRPTWQYAAAPEWEDVLRNKASSFRGDEDREETRRQAPPPPPDQRENSPEREALAIMALEPPVDFKKVRERYRTLMKTYHPDRNPGDAQAEEIVKRVNMAYTVLKVAYEKYESITT